MMLAYMAVKRDDPVSDEDQLVGPNVNEGMKWRKSSVLCTQRTGSRSHKTLALTRIGGQYQLRVAESAEYVTELIGY